MGSSYPSKLRASSKQLTLQLIWLKAQLKTKIFSQKHLPAQELQFCFTEGEQVTLQVLLGSEKAGFDLRWWERTLAEKGLSVLAKGKAWFGSLKIWMQNQHHLELVRSAN